MDQRQRTRLALSIGAAGVIGTVVIAAMLGGRPPTPQPAPPPAAPAPDAGEEVVAPAPPPPIVRRAELLSVAAQAAAAYAGAQPYAEANRALVGRRFEIVLPFGCSGPAGEGSPEPARWEADAKARTATLLAQPRIWTEEAWIAPIAGPGPFDAVEGFWVTRPWLAAESCPTPRVAPDAPDTSNAQDGPPPSQPSVGLVQLFGAEASRLRQRGSRPYRTVRKLAEGEPAVGPREYHLVLSGRISGLAGGEAVGCHSPSIDQRPTCLVGMEVASVAFVDPATGEVLAEWAG